LSHSAMTGVEKRSDWAMMNGKILCHKVRVTHSHFEYNDIPRQSGLVAVFADL
jgi:hypothetical protein